MTAGFPFPLGTLGGLGRCSESLLALILEEYQSLPAEKTEQGSFFKHQSTRIISWHWANH